MKALACDDATRGQSLALGASVHRSGVNFAVLARHATGAQLLLFEPKNPSQPSRSLDLDYNCHRTGDIWHVSIAGVQPGWAYAWRMSGPFTPEEGYRYDARRLVLDPHAIALVGTADWEFARLREDGVPRSGDSATLVSPADAAFTAKSLVACNG